MFDNDIRSRFEGFAPDPPGEVWLSVRDAIVVAPRKSMIPVFFRVAAAIAFLAISGLTVMFITSDRPVTAPLADADALTGAVATPHEDVSVTESGTTTTATVPAIPAATSTAGLLAAVGPAPATPAIFPGDTDTPTTAAPVREEMAYPTMKMATGIAINPVDHPIALSLHDRPVNTYKATGPVNFAGNITEADFGSAPAGVRLPAGISFGMQVSPRFNERYIADPGSLLASGKSFNLYEQTAMSYSYGLTASLRILPRLELQTGVGYASLTQMIKGVNAWVHKDNSNFFEPGNTHPQDIVTSFGVFKVNSPNLWFDEQSEIVLTDLNAKLAVNLPDDPKLYELFLEQQSQEFTQSFSYIEIPLVARYRLLTSRYLDIHAKAGVAGNILISNEVTHRSAVIGETAGVRTFSYSGIGGFALSVPVTNRLRLFVEPTAQMFLQPILTDEMLSLGGKTYPYCFTLASGISFRF